jgi:hypothetical protein
MQAKKQYPAVLIWYQWSFLTAIPLAIGLSYYYLWGTSPSGNDVVWYLIVFSVVGTLQWRFILRQYLKGFARWIYFTALGWIIAIIIGGLSIQIASSLVGRVLGSSNLILASGNIIWGIIIGFSIGGAQWLVLHERANNAIWWLRANILGYGIAIPVILEFYRLGIIRSGGLGNKAILNPLIVLIGILLGSSIIGTLTATAMAWLLRPENIKDQADTSNSSISEIVKS